MGSENSAWREGLRESQSLLVEASRFLLSFPASFEGGSEFEIMSGSSDRLKNLPAVQEIWTRFLGWDDPLEEGLATHSSLLAWRIPWIEDPGWLWSMGS